MFKNYFVCVVMVFASMVSWYTYKFFSSGISTSESSYGKAVEDDGEQLDLIRISRQIEHIKDQASERKNAYVSRELALAKKDKKASEIIAKLQSKHGISEQDFRQKYSAVFSKMEK